jgi:nucleotide-binding universal stress UspA family protein
MNVFEKILVPLDGSDHSFKALDAAIQIAKKFTGKITLVHVYRVSATVDVNYEASQEPGIPATGVPVMTASEVSKLDRYASETGNSILAEGKRRVSAEKVGAETVLREGHVVEEISRVAEEGNFGLIVIGARGVSHIREMFLGSVTESLMHNASCPVLVVK